jgi:hypothetical protein
MQNNKVWSSGAIITDLKNVVPGIEIGGTGDAPQRILSLWDCRVCFKCGVLIGAVERNYPTLLDTVYDLDVKLSLFYSIARNCATSGPSAGGMA